ncbi:MAG: radical SAM protein [Oscillospiraceae bacterium]
MNLNIPDKCYLCPRMCGANRNITQGFCGAENTVRLARAALHMWEEPCISGTKGSGTVFFSGCPLKCCYCQNYHISAENFGKDISTLQLAQIFTRMENEGAHNINLVTASAYLPFVIDALEMAKPKIPVVYNTSGYETLNAINALKPYVDIWLTDLKYMSTELSGKYSSAANYFEYASAAILKMHEYSPKPIFNDDGILQKGLIVRYLALPGALNDGISCLNWLHENMDSDSFLLSLMSQYTPFYKATEYKELSRRIYSYEYNKLLSEAEKLGLTNGFMQKRSSAKEEYTPIFDLEGVDI